MKDYTYRSHVPRGNASQDALRRLDYKDNAITQKNSRYVTNQPRRGASLDVFPRRAWEQYNSVVLCVALYLISWLLLRIVLLSAWLEPQDRVTRLEPRHQM